MKHSPEVESQTSKISHHAHRSTASAHGRQVLGAILPAALLVLVLASACTHTVEVLTLIPRHPAACPDRIVSFEVKHETSVESPDTDDDFLLVIRLDSGPPCQLPFPDIRGDERQPGRPDEYILPTGGRCELSSQVLEPRHLYIRTKGSHQWLPFTIKVVAHTEASGPRTLVDRNDRNPWPDNQWFSTELDDCEGQDQCLPEWQLQP